MACHCQPQAPARSAPNESPAVALQVEVWQALRLQAKQAGRDPGAREEKRKTNLGGGGGVRHRFWETWTVVIVVDTVILWCYHHQGSTVRTWKQMETSLALPPPHLP